ncbi:GAF domain-containing protein [Nocardioides guangzhouensis]|uniref:GAF domain-containing protein n=1 Tax=Nocardioides guangzhouensis TaxID=2497878 RepID=UPI00143857D3|nr:GAF domain-containing protein [Nocardioides guangzhouensis]
MRELVPDCLGISLALLDHDVTLTLVANPSEFVLLDALQYLVDDSGTPRSPDDAAAPGADQEPADVLDERRWRRLSLESSARGVASTLSMPVFDHDRLVGAVSLYGGSPNAFGGQHEELADVLGAWAEGAVTNADLSFASLASATRAPRKVAGSILVAQAAEILARDLEIAPDAARQHLHRAAARAGVTPVELAITVIRGDL